MHKTQTWPEPTLGLIFKTQTRSYCLVGQVKPDSLWLSWVGCLQVELYLPSLLKDGLAVGIFLLLTPDNFLYYHEQIHNFTTTFLRGRLLNTCFQFLNNIIRIFTHFFTHTYF